MAYIGVSPNAGTVATQIITTANGSATSFTLDQTVPDGQSIIVLVGNVVQQPTHQGIAGAYTASGNTITFTGPPANGDNIIIRYLGRSVDVATNYKRIIRYRYVATNGQQTFSGEDSNGLTLSYTVEDIDVFLNGVRLDQTDFTATNGTSVVLVSGATTSDELVILAYNTVQLADTVPASTGGTFSGAVTINGAFTSQGIDDNANATAMTIDSAENIGIGQAPETGHHSNWTAVDIGNRGGIAQYKTVGDVTLTYNLYHDGAWKAKETAPSGRYVIGAGPYHIWYTGASASADASVTLTERMRINDNGAVGIGDDDPVDKLHVKGGQAQIESVAGDGAYLRINNTANSGGKIWRAGDGVLSHGTFSIYDQTDNTFPFNVSMDGVVGSTVTLGVARYRNHASISLGYGSNVHLTVGQGLVNVSNRSYGYGALFMVSYASQVAEVSDPSNQFDIGSGGNILGAGVYKNNNDYTIHVINKDTNGGTRGFSVQVISNDF